MAEEKLSDKIADDVKTFVDLRVDAVKLSVVEALASVVGKGIALVICLFLINLALVLLTGAAVYGLSLLIGSVLWSAIIIAAVYLIVGVVIFMRPGFFVNKMVGVFSPMFFCPRKDDDDEEDQ